MENASKALLIAAGILFAILILSLILVVSNNMRDLANADDERIAARQLAAFNAEFEAYNKRAMYGTDVITLVNKAIDNNIKLGVDVDESRWFIDVELKVIEDMKSTRIIETISNGRKERNEDFTFAASEPMLRKDIIYNLKRIGSTNQMDANIVKFFNKRMQDTIESQNPPTNTIIWYTYEALTLFKRGIFRCENVEYEDGRISKITIHQTKIAER
jgi:hypothetical protein